MAAATTAAIETLGTPPPVFCVDNMCCPPMDVCSGNRVVHVLDRACDRDPFLLEQVGDERRAALDLDSSPAQATEHIDAPGTDEDHAGKIEHHAIAGSDQSPALFLEHVGPLHDDSSLENQDHAMGPTVMTHDAKHVR